ncbi:MAG: hypothetical protein VX492_02330 [Candidatus Thermoplasmatota archaeon]|nr:hypothetical protein [Candidatus Thermoplasmatota archaeon]
MVFDKFKSWRSNQNLGVPCPSCQHRNQEGTRVCTRCYYQLDKAAFEQDPGLEDSESSDLLDQLMSEIEKEDSEEEHIPTAFSMDDVTIDVEQYGEDEQIVLTSAPAFESIITSQEPEEEEYELTAADIPEFVQKFEIPDEKEDPETDDPLEVQTVELIQPTADTPDNVEVVSASEVPDSNGWPEPSGGLPVSDPADFDGDGKVDEFEAEFAFGDNTLEEPTEATSPEQDALPPIPPAPVDLPIPRIASAPVSKVEEAMPPPLPPAPMDLPEPNPPAVNDLETEEDRTFWPWHQQEEWPAADIYRQLQAAIRAAKEQNTAEATVLLDEVGPHLGKRTSLAYSVGRLLMSIGRNREAISMIESASEAYPEDQDIAKAREKLSS